jgi:Mg/Co/Ni transporter MgtE
MNPPSTDKLRSILARGGPEKAADLLQRLDPAVAADAMLDMPFEDQRAIFGRMPIPFAAKLVAEFPYYLAYVLLQSRPQNELVAIVDQMDSDDRMQFIEELPEGPGSA